MDNVEKLDVMDALKFFKANLDESGGGNAVTDTATSSVAGLTKLYDELGNATDGAVTQSTVTKFVNAKRYGYLIKKTESEPYERVEYLFDAAAMTPAKMDFENGVFDYGSWANVWFVKDNKPLMLDSDGTIAYYLDPNDYSLKEDGTSSDITDTSTTLNAMAQIPLCWIKRYEDDEYFYEIVSNVQYDEDYKAYAHTDADGNIKDYFYNAMFGASGDATKLRSLSGQTLAGAMQTSNQISGATANGSNWYIGTWSQHELIRTLLILISKSCDTQASFGNGNAHYPATNASYLLPTGTLSDKGQFFGYTDNNKQVKVFHIEGFWGDQLLRVAGVIKQLNSLYVKMTPEGDGYQFPLETPTGYTQLEFYDYVDTLDQSVKRFFTGSFSCSEFGMLPLIKEGETPIFGSNSTYFCDAIWYNRRSPSTIGLLTGGCVNDYPNDIGAFSATLEYGITYAGWQYGCALSYI